MVFELRKIVGRFKEASGKKFVKIPQSLVNLEEKLESINDELATVEQDKTNELGKQQLQSHWLATMRAIEEIKKKIKPS